jgi:DNA-binding transcriptional MerR regulator
MKKGISIGDFSRMTHLSIKTLRHYHEVGLLAPAEIDEVTGYRYYTKSQVPVAQVIRRLRGLDLPLEELRSILGSADPAARGAVIAGHLDRLERQVSETHAAIVSLRSLLERPETPIAVEHRVVPQAPALAISERVSTSELAAWIVAAFTELHGALRSLGLNATEPSGGLWPTELFSLTEGEAVVFLPVQELPSRAVGRARPFLVPAAELAITVHEGPHTDVDRTYGALGTYVAEHELGVDGPIREYYLSGRFTTPDATLWRTEIGWPIFQTTVR